MDRGINSSYYNKTGDKVIIVPDDLSIREFVRETEEVPYLLYENRLSNRPQSAYYVHSNPELILVKFADDKIFATFSIESGRWIHTFYGHFGRINSFSFSPCGRFVLTASEDRSIKEWELNSGKCLRTFKGHRHGIVQASYSSNGKCLISASKDGMVRVWNIESGEYFDEFYIESGLFIQGLDLRYLHPDSKFTEEEKTRLRRYGALFTDEDEKKWRESLNYAYGEDQSSGF